MEAQLVWAANRPLRLSLALVVLSLLPAAARGAGYRTKNFTVDAPTPQLAKEIGDAAEVWRKSLANEWLGRELAPWGKPCPIKAQVSPQLLAGGATSFVFDRGEVFDWRMNIQGTRERVLDSVLPHEITHTIFATHFRQPLPRWADEGACTTVEHHSEIDKQERMLITFLKTRRGIPFSDMFAMKEYPSDVLPLYAQGHSLARYLIAQRGKREFLAFLADGMQDENWPRAIRAHYEYDHLLALQDSWMGWVRAGRPAIQPAGGVMLASAQAPEPPPAPEVRAEVAATMAPLVQGPTPARSLAIPPVAAADPQARTAQPATPVAPQASEQPPAERRSVYGESASWQPARTRPIVPASTGAIAHDASRTSGTVWR